MAGSSSRASRSTPITEFTSSSLAMMFSRTSGISSLSSVRNTGSKCSIVRSLPSVGAKPITTDASAARTCWLASPASSLTLGTISAVAASGPTSRHSSLASPALAMRTSASPSASRRSYAPTSSARAVCAPTHSHRSYSCLATA